MDNNFILGLSLGKAAGGGGASGTKQISINSNGTTTENVASYASAEIIVNVPNSYTAGDEGKVVSNGALVAQTAHAKVTSNGTIDTTLNNSVEVDVPGPAPVKHGTWTRPAKWPNYESLHMENSPNDYSVYLTYDTRPNKAGLTRQGIAVKDRPTGTVFQVGQIVNGAFVAEETIDPPNNENTGITLENYAADFVVLKIDMNNATDGGSLSFNVGSATFYDSALEIYGRPKSETMFGYNVANRNSIGEFVQSVLLLDYTAPANFSFQYTGFGSFSLEYINIADYTISSGNARNYNSLFENVRFISGELVMPSQSAEITSITNFTNSCKRLTKIDVSKIDTQYVTAFG